MNFPDVLALSYRMIRSNKLRSGITIAIIAFGIMALIGIITAIQAMNQKLTESFSTMGANGFTLKFKQKTSPFDDERIDLKILRKGAKKEKRSDLDKPIRIFEAEEFIQYYHFPSESGIAGVGNNNTIISFKSHKTNPNVLLLGGDEQYLDLNGFAISKGRNFSTEEINSAQNVCLLGNDVAKKLFKQGVVMAIDQMVRIDEIPYKVIGVLASRGSTFGFSRDNIVITSYRNLRRNYGINNFTIGVKTNDVTRVEPAIGEAESLFRSIRKLEATEADNFELERSDSVAEKAMSVLSYLTIAVIIIGFITLAGSAIGLMNIMLVSVSERTKEVGLSKAIGAKKSMIIQQFLSESILISTLGALFGILSGILVGNIFSIILDTGFVIPWGWIAYGILICTVVGLCAGLYPAIKAGKLNPIEALRYE